MAVIPYVDDGYKNKKRNLMKIGICITFNPVFTHIFKVNDIKEDFKKFAELGYKGIELSVRDVDDINWYDFDMALQSNSLELTTIATGLVRKIDNISLIDENYEGRNRAISRIKKMIEHITTYKNRDKNILIGYIKGELSGSDTENKKRMDLLNKSLWDLLELAEQKKVRLLIEVINHKETNFITKISSGVEFISGFNSDYLKLVIDTFHMHIDEKDSYKAIKEAGLYIGYVHIADSGRKFPGEGSIDFKPVLKALDEIDYNGYLMIECNDKDSTNSQDVKNRYKSLASGYNHIINLL